MIGEVAEKLGYSQSSISHSIKKHLGMSFRDLCILKRIERFEKIITDDPTITIIKAAEKIGYDDPLNFSRIYKSVRPRTPTAFIRTVRPPAISRNVHRGSPIAEYRGTNRRGTVSGYYWVLGKYRISGISLKCLSREKNYC
jgi:AraC-like DNA-binding protein